MRTCHRLDFSLSCVSIHSSQAEGSMIAMSFGGLLNIPCGYFDQSRSTSPCALCSPSMIGQNTLSRITGLVKLSSSMMNKSCLDAPTEDDVSLPVPPPM